ncbi:uncharacterized protein AMSG_11973 [Thecamonas trahens ATCC 50062]|uniref:Tyrosyl-DNA phosphodiesterase 1 n=1 Tax=Thecamonas trahens ATCC 50062 TaxID=461836 RepID=A0A0L0DDN0_THETB|nr:hypothetical protein AMSG_11973 [Thecamonas trahens ATCC 50062]KNC50226.1 hypothetical protein AMSG_11973 [Thecamonas trahens ATCC 50062]|eukprot:XP_013757130.1 hypothetical protein AMSG_11973 [Thecamonas trahens ATCC 50062]
MDSSRSVVWIEDVGSGDDEYAQAAVIRRPPPLTIDLTGLSSEDDEPSAPAAGSAPASAATRKRQRSESGDESGVEAKRRRTAAEAGAAGDGGDGGARYGFRLIRPRRFEPASHDGGWVRLEELVPPADELEAMVLTSYTFDLEWLASAIPALMAVPTLVLAEARALLPSAAQVWAKALSGHESEPHVHVIYPRVLGYGTHHTKAMLFFSPDRVRVVIHTANMEPGDWESKSQGVWSADFERKATRSSSPTSRFEADLIRYFEHHSFADPCALPRLRAFVLDRLPRYEFGPADSHVRLIASVPGSYPSPGYLPPTGGQGRRMTSATPWTAFGHLALRCALDECAALASGPETSDSIALQCSSLGSMTKKWYADQLLASMEALPGGRGRAGAGATLYVPSAETVRSSVQGYAGGGSLPILSAKVRRAVKAGVAMARWDAAASGLVRHVPHIKSYARVSGNDPRRLWWVLLTSANLSKPAWGVIERAGTPSASLRIESYELGVVFLPQVGEVFEACFEPPPPPIDPPGSDSDSSDGEDGPAIGAAKVIRFPLPHRVGRPDRFEHVGEDRELGMANEPWMRDKPYSMPDPFGVCDKLDHMHARYTGTGSAETDRETWAKEQARDTTASFLAHPPLGLYLAVARNDSVARVRYDLLRRLPAPHSAPPPSANTMPPAEDG